MIDIPRGLARCFRSVLRRALSGLDSRPSCPLIVCRSDKNGLILEAYQDDIGVRYQANGSAAPGAIAFRASVLAEFEGRTDEPVRLEQVQVGKGRASWMDGGVPKVLDFDTVAVDSAPAFPSLPKQRARLPGSFLEALNEATKTSARDSVRTGLSRIQLRGRAGEIVATDGRQLLVQRGFELPWQEDVLVPRMPAFGCRELAGEESVGVGRTKSHVAVQVGSWTLLLGIDATSRFPGIESVIPKASSTTSRVQFDPADAEFMAATLPKLPGHDEHHSPVTLDLSMPVAVRAQDERKGPITEVVLNRSSASGPALRLSTDSRLLLRALKLGFAEVQVAKADTALVCRDARRIYVWMPLEKESVVAPSQNMVRIASAEDTIHTPPPGSERRKKTMPAPLGNGHRSDNSRSNDRQPEPDNGLSSDRQPEQWGIAEVIAETETLRTVLQDASARTMRLLTALKHKRRQSRAVQAAMASLKQLQLEP